MKQILILAAACLMTACTNQPQSETPAQTSAPADSVETGTPADYAGTDTVKQAVVLNGVIMLPPQQQATLTLTISGVIHSASLLPGSRVKKGQTIATVANPDFISLQQEFLDAQAQTEYLAKEYARQQTLASHEAASQKTLQQSKAQYLAAQSTMQASQAKLRLLGVDTGLLRQQGIQAYLEVKAPLSGYLTDFDASTGKYIEAGQPLAKVVDKSRMMLKLTAYEKDLPRLKTGSTVRFSVNGSDGQTFGATIISIDQRVDEDNRSVEVYADVKNVQELFRPGMYVSARVE